MTQKILDLIEEINREGFDNSMWGVTKVDDWDIVELFGDLEQTQCLIWQIIIQQIRHC